MAEQLSDREGAIAAYRKILAVDPEDPNALRLLGRLLGAAERWDDLADVLSRARWPSRIGSRTSSPRRRSCATGSAGSVTSGSRTRTARSPATARCSRRCRGTRPRSPRSRTSRARAGPPRCEAATLLEPIYSAEGEYQKVDRGRSRPARERDRAGRARGAPAAHRRACTAARSGTPRWRSSRRAGRSPRIPTRPSRSISAAATPRRPGSATSSRRCSPSTPTARTRPAARAEYQRRIARLAHGRAGARRGRVAARCSTSPPTNREAIAGLVAALREVGEPEALAQAVRRALAVEDVAEARAALLAELAAIQDERLGDPAGAIQTPPRAARARARTTATRSRGSTGSASGPSAGWTSPTCSRARSRRRRRRGTTPLSPRSGSASRSSRRRACSTARARSRSTRRCSPPARITRRRSRGSRRCSRRTRERARGVDPGGRLRAAAATPRSRQRCSRCAPRERPDPLERKALYVELAELREQKLGDPQLAFLALCKAFREDPADAALRARMEALADASGHEEELAAIYEDELDRLPPPDTAEVALRLGALYEEKLGEPSRAATFLRRAVALDPAPPRAALPALERLYARLERWPELADVLAQRAGTPRGAERVQLLFRLGQLCEERLAAPDRAAEAYEAAVAADPRHVPSLRALEALYEGAGRREDLFRNLAAPARGARRRRRAASACSRRWRRSRRTSAGSTSRSRSGRSCSPRGRATRARSRRSRSSTSGSSAGRTSPSTCGCASRRRWTGARSRGSTTSSARSSGRASATSARRSSRTRRSSTPTRGTAARSRRCATSTRRRARWRRSPACTAASCRCRRTPPA